MAFQFAGYWSVSFTFVDNNYKSATTGVYLPGGTTLSGAETFAADLAGKLQAASDAHLTSYNIFRSYRNDAADPKTPSSEVERKLVVTYADSIAKYVGKMEVPSPLFSMEVEGTDLVPLTNALVAALVDVLTTGNVGPLNGPVTWAGSDITQVKTAYITHRHRKQTK
jgi:hypothetical protein